MVNSGVKWSFVVEKHHKSGKNVFDFQEKCIYNGSCGPISGPFMEKQELQGNENERGNRAIY